jgi:hypothetical protein
MTNEAATHINGNIEHQQQVQTVLKMESANVDVELTSVIHNNNDRNMVKATC